VRSSSPEKKSLIAIFINCEESGAEKQHLTSGRDINFSSSAQIDASVWCHTHLLLFYVIQIKLLYFLMNIHERDAVFGRGQGDNL
jgi:hypothetical protein